MKYRRKSSFRIYPTVLTGYCVRIVTETNDGESIKTRHIYVRTSDGFLEYPTARETVELYKMFELDPKLFNCRTDCIEVRFNENE